MHRRKRTAIAGLTVLALALTGCAQDGSAPASAPAPAQVDAPPAVVDAPGTAAPAPVDQPSVAPTEQAKPSPLPPPKPTYDVAKAQRTLAELGYYLGAADGRRGPALRSAVMAFQKVQGLGADGTVGPATLKALDAPRAPVLKGGPSNRVEVDLTRQVLYVVKAGAVQRILPVSSGNGATYEQKDGGSARALTPTGYYRIQRRIVGVREADLGTLYDPQYFYRGWAIHGSNSVPARPASHGCVRVTRADATWLLSNISVGMSVHLYGGKHVFSAGSSAPGTDSPTGDTASDAPPTTASSSPRPSRSPSPASTPTPARTSPSPSTAPSSPRPTPSPSGTTR